MRKRLNPNQCMGATDVPRILYQLEAESRTFRSLLAMRVQSLLEKTDTNWGVLSMVYSWCT